MFNGIVETVGIIEKSSFEDGCLKLTISSSSHLDELQIGHSIAVNGICLTVTDITHNHFNVTIVPETLRKSNLKKLLKGSFVNLERSLKVNGRINGHIVQGHIDGVGEILDLNQDGDGASLLKIKMPKFLKKYIVRKGYIAIDGMSITAIEAEQDWFSITLIPHTKKSTIADKYEIGSLVNIEVDILGKYLEKMLMEGNYAEL